MRKDDITVEILKEVLRYDSETGKLYWLVSRGSTVKPGTEAGTETSFGCLQMSLFGLRVQISHVVWFLNYGRWPHQDFIIGHIDRNPKNNRLMNLREVTQEVNSLHYFHRNSNQGIYETSSGKFCVVYKKDGLSICHDSFPTLKQARKSLKEITDGDT